MLSWLSLAVHEVGSLRDVVPGQHNHILAIARLEPGQAAPSVDQWRQAGLASAVCLTAGAVASNTPPPGTHLSEPICETAVAAALAGANLVLPLAEECRAIGLRVSSLVDGDTVATAQLLDTLLATNQSDLHGLRQACDAQHWGTAQSYAHRIKSTAHMTGAVSLAKLSQRMEVLAQQRHAEPLRALAAIYQPAVQRLSDALAALIG